MNEYSSVGKKPSLNIFFGSLKTFQVTLAKEIHDIPFSLAKWHIEFL
jgi:hypothetical protein